MDDKRDYVFPSFMEFVASRDKAPAEQTTVQAPYSEKNALEFAHPVDKNVIKFLNNPTTRHIFCKFVEANTDVVFGLLMASGIRVNETNYPDLYRIIKECADDLKVKFPYVIISSNVNGINAQTAGSEKYSFIAISSLLSILLSIDEQKFILGHECGHIALGHVVYHTALRTIGDMCNLLPLLGPIMADTARYPLYAWSRRSEISADRAGLICCKDINVAARTLLRLEAGWQNIDKLDVDEYIADCHKILSDNVAGKYLELFKVHPILPKRIEALKLFAISEKYYKITGLDVPARLRLISDRELEARTESIVKVIR